jgi:chromosome segregation ATPase
MADAPTDAVPQILTKIQDSISTLRSELGTVRSELGTLRSDLTPRLDRIENIVRKQRRDAAGMLVLMRTAASDFDERISDLGERVSALEDRAR